MLLERQTVSRKTPIDGKLEISHGAVEHLRSMPGTLEVEIGMLSGPASLETLTCTCRKIGRAHEHQFLASELLKSLPAATLVELRAVTIRGREGEHTRLTVLPVDGSTV